MAMSVDVIYCAGANRRLMEIALAAGFLLGVRSDRASYGMPLAFVDVEYTRPNWHRHLRRVAGERSKYAVVPDLRADSVDLLDVARACTQADELSAYCAVPLIVPKLVGQLDLIPVRYAIAYSVPSSYGGARFGPWKLAGRRVHLLGGSPQMQRRIYRSLRASGIAEVLSVDGNMAQKVAIGKLNYWEGGVWKKAPRGIPDGAYQCWERSCRNILGMWRAECGMGQEAA